MSYKQYMGAFNYIEKIRQAAAREMGVPARSVGVEEDHGIVIVNLPNPRNTMTLSSEERAQLKATLEAAAPGIKVSLV